MTATAAPQDLPFAATMAQDLATLIAMQGRLILDDRARLLLKLRELMPDRARATNLLMTAFDSGAVHQFATSSASTNPLAMEQMAQSIVDSTGMQVEFARWALDVWHRTLSPNIGVTSPDIAQPQNAGAIALSAQAADNITWDDDEPASAPSTATTTSPPAAAVIAPPPARKGSAFKWVAVAAVVLIAVGGGLYASGLLGDLDRFSFSWDSEPDQKPVTRSSQTLVMPGQPVTAAQVKEASIDVTTGGMLNKRQPTFPSAYQSDGVQEHWQFQFNVRDQSGKRFAYHVNLIARNDNQTTQGFITAIDRSLSDDTLLSVSNLVTVLNAPSKLTDDHMIWKMTWAKNPSKVPAICVQLYTNHQEPGRPRRPAFFFVQSLVDGYCEPKLGDGDLQ